MPRFRDRFVVTGFDLEKVAVCDIMSGQAENGHVLLWKVFFI